MKITGGSLRGRPIERPKTAAVRPITGLVVEALFSILGPLDGLVLLDAYAGTGAIGLEALSRGALLAEGVEASRTVARLLQRNADSLGVSDRYVVNVAKVEDWLGWPANQKPRFDIAIAGPPFAKIDLAVMDRLGGVVKPAGLLVIWYSSRLAVPELKSVKLVQTKVYGDSALSFFTKSKL